jgi:hypothetical protein
VDFDIGIVGVSFAGQQRLDLVGIGLVGGKITVRNCRRAIKTTFEESGNGEYNEVSTRGEIRD